MGADLLQTKDPEKTFERLHEHVASVRRKHLVLRDSTVVIIVERNLGFEAEHLYRYPCLFFRARVIFSKHDCL